MGSTHVGLQFENALASAVGTPLFQRKGRKKKKTGTLQKRSWINLRNFINSREMSKKPDNKKLGQWTKNSGSDHSLCEFKLGKKKR
jgi:hypothetical protein